MILEWINIISFQKYVHTSKKIKIGNEHHYHYILFIKNILFNMKLWIHFFRKFYTV